MQLKFIVNTGGELFALPHRMRLLRYALPASPVPVQRPVLHPVHSDTALSKVRP